MFNRDYRNPPSAKKIEDDAGKNPAALIDSTHIDLQPFFFFKLPPCF